MVTVDDQDVKVIVTVDVTVGVVEAGAGAGPKEVGTRVPPKRGQIPLPSRRAKGYKTRGIPLVMVAIILPLKSVVKAVQLKTSTTVWPAPKPVPDDTSLIVLDEPDPMLEKTPTTCEPVNPLRVAMVWLSEYTTCMVWDI